MHPVGSYDGDKGNPPLTLFLEKTNFLTAASSWLLKAPDFPIDPLQSIAMSDVGLMDQKTVGPLGQGTEAMYEEQVKKTIRRKNSFLFDFSKLSNIDYKNETDLVNRIPIANICEKIKAHAEFSESEKKNLDSIVFVFFVFIYSKNTNFGNFYYNLKTMKSFEHYFQDAGEKKLPARTSVMKTIRKVCKTVHQHIESMPEIAGDCSFVSSLSKYYHVLQNRDSVTRLESRKRRAEESLKHQTWEYRPSSPG